MRKRLALAALLAALTLGFLAGALAPIAEAGPTCFPGDECNVCCWAGNKLICTQRVCSQPS